VAIVPPCSASSHQQVLATLFQLITLAMHRSTQPPSLPDLHPRCRTVVALLQLLQVPEGVCSELLVLCFHLGLTFALLLQLAGSLALACQAACLQQLLAALDFELVSCAWCKCATDSV
jgi:hypothetical protein